MPNTSILLFLNFLNLKGFFLSLKVRKEGMRMVAENICNWTAIALKVLFKQKEEKENLTFISCYTYQSFLILCDFVLKAP